MLSTVRETEREGESMRALSRRLLYVIITLLLLGVVVTPEANNNSVVEVER